MKKDTRQILLSSELSENDIRLICKRANDETTRKETLDILSEFEDNFRITREQSEKGLNWLLNQWKSPRGVERKNNPFGYREQDVLEHFDHFTFDSLYDAGNYQHSWYAPIYSVHTADGGSFQYVLRGGRVSIIG